ncbi:nuclear transport factor 2 family protein [Sphingopyxis sp.]|uniref:nuclear transport factor 2 family protein n=1 Tax=Sphingopyxis sp. TaxID=1908224 RepID=UPI002FC5AFB8
MSKSSVWIITAAAALVSCSATSATSFTPGAVCDGSAEENRKIVLNFYNEGLVGLQPRAAFERYMTPDFVEHKPDVPQGTREAAAGFLEQLIAAVPQPRWEVVRTIAEGDMVFLHGRFTPAAGAPYYAIADVFRLEDCKIAEHWDVVGPPPKDQANPNPRF